MPLRELNLENMMEVKGGMVAEMLRRQLNRMCVDIQAAPDIDEWREATLKIKAKPRSETVNGMVTLQDVVVEFHVPGVKVPVRSTSIMSIVRNSDFGNGQQLHFQLDAPDNPEQETLFDPSEESDELQ